MSELTMSTANGRITCRRCTARSSRTGSQCARPALKVSKTQKCQFHGGRGSGPKTAEGRARIAAAKTVHGQRSKQATASISAALAMLGSLEDAMRVLGMTGAPRKQGRKATGYVPVRSVNDVWRLVDGEMRLRAEVGAVDQS